MIINNNKGFEKKRERLLIVSRVDWAKWFARGFEARPITTRRTKVNSRKRAAPEQDEILSFFRRERAFISKRESHSDISADSYSRTKGTLGVNANNQSPLRLFELIDFL